MAYGHYRNGFLMEPGGWASQPYGYTEAMRFVESLVKTHEKADLDG